ncbi:MAG: hypothetical protein WBX15_14040 [Thermoanaerobaculia bacterium]
MTPKRIELLARAIVNRLEDRGLVEFSDAEAGIEMVARTLMENERQADAICEEARERLARNGVIEPSLDELENEMHRIAGQQGFVL